MIFSRSNILSKLTSFLFIFLITFILTFIIFISFKPIKVNIFDANFNFLKLDKNKITNVGDTFLSFNKSSKNFEILIENLESEKIIIPDLLLALDLKTIFSGSLTPNIIKIYDANIKLNLLNNSQNKKVEEIFDQILESVYQNLSLSNNDEKIFFPEFNIIEVNNSTLNIKQSKELNIIFYPVDLKISSQNDDLKISGLLSQIDEELKRNISFSLKRNFKEYEGKLKVNNFDLNQFKQFFDNELFDIDSLDITGETDFKISDSLELKSFNSTYNFHGKLVGDFESKENILSIDKGNFITKYSSARNFFSSKINLLSNSTEFKINFISNNKKKSASLSLNKTSFASLEKYWPVTFKNSARDWVNNNITGDISDLFLKFDLNKNDISIKSLTGSFQFESVVLNYLDTMPNIFDLEGMANIYDDRLEFDVISGNSRGLDLLNGKIKIVDLDKEIERALINIEIATNLNDLNSYLKLSPISNEKYTELKSIKANANIKLNLELPLLIDLPIEKIIYSADLKTKNAEIYNVFESFNVENASISATINQNNVIYSGSGLFNNFPINFKSNEDLFDSNEILEINLEIKPDFINDFFPDLIQYSEGLISLNILINENNKTKKSKIIGTANLSKFQAFSKLLNIKHNYDDGELLFEIKNIGNNKNINLSLKTNKNDILADILIIDNFLEELRVEKFKTLNQDFRLTIRKKDDYFVSNFEGKKIDISNLVEKSDGYSNENLNLEFNFAVDQLIFSGRVINDPVLRGRFKRNSFDFLDFEIKSDNKKHLIKIDEFSKTLEVSSNDASDLLSFFYEEPSFEGGVLNINASKIDKKYKGIINMEKFVSIDAPFFTKVLSFFSIEGVEQQLKGGGVFFDKLKTDYSYEQDILFLDNGLIRGSDIGLTFDGKYDFNDEETDINGTFIPAYTLNTLLTNLPLLGDIISAGQPEEGILAATFNIKKINKETEISFNPISVIVPSIIRNFLDSTDKKND